MGKIRGLPLLFIVVLWDSLTGINSLYREPYKDLWTFESDYSAVNDNDEANHDWEQRSQIPKHLDILMPDVSPQKHDTYYCTAIEMPKEDAYIVGYEPHAEKETAHHMLMFGCDDVEDHPGKYWNCGEMGGTCTGSVNKVMYAWARDATALTLPKDVGFHVGGESDIKYIVLQVHYANVDKFKKYHELTDQSGVTLDLGSTKPKYFAGIYLVAAGGPPIPARTPVFDMDMACKYTVGPEMHPFAFRVHAHKLGAVVTGYRVRDGKHWNLIGKGDPQRPQAFYDVASNASLKAGDVLAGRCTYDSSKRDRRTYIGATGADEMCNFYLMYYYDPAGGIKSTDACVRVPILAEDYPPGTDVPLPPAPEMEMRRSVEDDEDLFLFSEE